MTALPKLSIPWLDEPAVTFNRRASSFWAECSRIDHERIFICDLVHGVYEEFYYEAEPLRVTVADLLCMSVYEWGGPTKAKPGRQWLTRYPYPWQTASYIRAEHRERPIQLCEVSPVDWPPGEGWITYIWNIEVIGDDIVFAALSRFWRPRPVRCVRHGRRVRCPVCPGKYPIICVCWACTQLPVPWKPTGVLRINDPYGEFPLYP